LFVCLFFQQWDNAGTLAPGSYLLIQLNARASIHNTLHFVYSVNKHTRPLYRAQFLPAFLPAMPTSTKLFSPLLWGMLFVLQATAQLPPLWEEAVLLEDLPVGPSGEVIVDPWVYTQRLGAMKSLIRTTTKHAPCLFENKEEENVLWGLALQFGWQYSSGRLFTNTTNLTSRSWWADMNYQLMIIPLLGASAAGYPEVPPIAVLPPKTDPDNIIFCRNTTNVTKACQRMQLALANWASFFRSIVSLEKTCSYSNRNDTFDSLVGAMWKAHTISLKEGLTLTSSALANFPKEEAEFGVGWANLVDFIASAHFVTNFNGTASQQTMLPMRMLKSGDKPGSIKGMSKYTNRGIVMIEKLSKLNEISKGKLLKLWERAMCSKIGRIEGRLLINEGIRNPGVLIPGILKITRDLFRPCD
jgi:hypothetical protein